MISRNNRIDRESSFTSERFQNSSKDVVISLQFSRIESHNATEKCERYHRTLRRMFNNTFTKHPQLSGIHVRRLSFKTINDTIGLGVLVPSLLVFVVLPVYNDRIINCVVCIRRIYSLADSMTKATILP